VYTKIWARRRVARVRGRATLRRGRRSHWVILRHPILYPDCLDPHRLTRVSESIREELEELINYELTDPRIGTLAVSEALVSPDYRHAHIRLALEGTAEEQEQTLAALEHAKAFLKYQLTERLQLYKTPDLHFIAGMSADLAAKAPQILKRIKRGRPKD
jgi:ribosome-binding factor A